jgi:hypothetical protein
MENISRISQYLEGFIRCRPTVQLSTHVGLIVSAHLFPVLIDGRFIFVEEYHLSCKLTDDLFKVLVSSVVS